MTATPIRHRIQARLNATLIEAVTYNKCDEVKYLLRSGADVNTKVEVRGSCLHLTLLGEIKENICDLLLAAGAQVNVRDTCGRTPLLLAAIRGADRTVMKLILRNQKIIDSCDNFNSTALHWAVMLNHKATVGLLLGNGAYVNPKDFQGYTPLHFAVQNNNPEIVKMLLCKNSNVDAQNQDGDRPLHIAFKNGFDSIVDLLLDANANIFIKNNLGLSPLNILMREK